MARPSTDKRPVMRSEPDVNSKRWHEGYNDGRNGLVCTDVHDQTYLDGFLIGDQERIQEER